MLGLPTSLLGYIDGSDWILVGVRARSIPQKCGDKHSAVWPVAKSTPGNEKSGEISTSGREFAHARAGGSFRRSSPQFCAILTCLSPFDKLAASCYTVGTVRVCWLGERDNKTHRATSPSPGGGTRMSKKLIGHLSPRGGRAADGARLLFGERYGNHLLSVPWRGKG